MEGGKAGETVNIVTSYRKSSCYLLLARKGPRHVEWTNMEAYQVYGYSEVSTVNTEVLYHRTCESNPHAGR